MGENFLGGVKHRPEMAGFSIDQAVSGGVVSQIFFRFYRVTIDMNTNLQFLPKRYNFISSYILEIMVVE